MSSETTDASIEDVLLVLGVDVPGELRVTASRVATSMPGCEYTARAATNPSRALAISAKIARALLLRGATTPPDAPGATGDRRTPTTR
jgi:hypothetical protein